MDPIEIIRVRECLFERMHYRFIKLPKGRLPYIAKFPAAAFVI